MTNIQGTTTRRSFLSLAAGVTAGSAALIMGSPAVASQDEPIFAAIEAHRAVTAMVLTALKTHARLECELPRSKRQSSVDAYGENIVATDDPRWIDSERAVAAAWDAQEDAACTLVSILPATMAGVMALLQYAVEADTDGRMWPDNLQSDDGKKIASWHQFLIANLIEILSELSSTKMEAVA